MDNLNAYVSGDNQVNEEKPPPRVCPRCNSDNTKFCYYNNYSMSQPRYTCKNCRRYWTHGGALRNIPIGGSGRKTKRTKTDQSSVSVDIQQVNHHQPFSHVQETNELVGSFGGSSSSSVVIGNHLSHLPDIHADMVLPTRSFQPLMNRFDFSDGSFHQSYYDVGSSDLIGNPVINQSIGVHVDNYNSYRINQNDQNKQQHQSFNNTMNMNYNAVTSESRGSLDHMNKNTNKDRNKCVLRCSYHLEKNGP